MNFDTAFERLIGHEGGYVNDVRDPGGETKYGISKRAYPNVNIASLTIDSARAIYKRDYWDRAQADKYDGAIGFNLFDAAVNSGVVASAKMLQRAVGAVDDGVIGPRTVAAVKALPAAEVVARFNGERLEFMASLPVWPTFGRGWARRIADNLRIQGA